jgi:hypothetical protein
VSTLPARTTLDIVLSVVQAVGLGLGGITLASGLGLMRRRRRSSKRAEPSLPQVVVGGILLLGGAAASIARGIQSAGDEAEEISSTRFSSATAPTISLEAPPNWLLTHDRAAGRLVATGPQARLIIDTSRVTDGINPEEFFTGVAKIATAAGGTEEDSFQETLDGFPALGRSFKYEGATAAVWFVPRGGPLLTTIACRSQGRASGRDACRPVLSALKWRAPGPL